ncbi:hypothetical protein [Methylobacterium trifolii]|uniref:Lipoprotein n=1 Tax=Methylobacterium trifolii TaxID=1003092 RepID=A0ABQ4TUT9_9HYPH|nr:hypothetical protein [Methylobacterium trifolii]GJE59056.1 hypothetical protein MPOCJGCO_1143 [Methylobacterium trifolii]
MAPRLAGPLLFLTLWSGCAAAQESERVRVCESLVDLRLLAAGTGSPPGCRSVARTEVGGVEHRAMVGGAPYECLVVASAGRCLWVLP